MMKNGCETGSETGCQLVECIGCRYPSLFLCKLNIFYFYMQTVVVRCISENQLESYLFVHNLILDIIFHSSLFQSFNTIMFNKTFRIGRCFQFKVKYKNNNDFQTYHKLYTSTYCSL